MHLLKHLSASSARGWSLLASGVLCAPLIIAAPVATVVVATHDSAAKSRDVADFVGDGDGDQEEINRAIKSLPAAGGMVLLMEGTYDIRKVEKRLGGVLIERSNVTLSGQGPSTRLIQAPEQNTNVIRIIGSNVGYVTIRDLYVDANRDQNPHGDGDPNVSHARFEFCGIKAYYRRPGGPSGKPNHHVTVRDCHVVNARRLGIMLEGHNMKVIDNVLGNAMSDSVEILTGPGEIRGNYVEITGRTHVAIGTDRANSILMADNIVHVLEGGDLDIAFRSWANSQRHVISGNVLTVDRGGRCKYGIDARGYGALITSNHLHTTDRTKPLLVKLSAGNTIVSGNVLENVIIEVNDETAEQKAILIQGNILDKTRVDYKKGKLLRPEHPSADRSASK